jgi:hypothetical protein
MPLATRREGKNMVIDASGVTPDALDTVFALE